MYSAIINFITLDNKLTKKKEKTKNEKIIYKEEYILTQSSLVTYLSTVMCGQSAESADFADPQIISVQQNFKSHESSLDINIAKFF